MKIHLYDTLSRKVRPFKPLQQNHAKIYSCGPTVYNNLHIGNLSAFIYADTLRRVLECAEFSVEHVMNITDVDDKTIRDSRRDYPDLSPHKALQKLTSKYAGIFFDDMKALEININNIRIISAVDSIPDMISLTQKLLDTGVAYVANDGIYFSIAEYVEQGNTYGILQNLEIASSKSRINNDEYDKDSANDFALWKKTLKDEPSWDASFSLKKENIHMPGRPGWHIECSAMSQKTLGVPFDIHTGGVDLKFPHHENEIAQTIGSGANKLAELFFHNAHILVDGKKMSKSLGNFFTLNDVTLKGYEPEVFRLVVLESHYRKESNFTWDILDAAQNRLNDLRAWADLQFQNFESEKLSSSYIESIKQLKNELAYDLNTPGALAVLSGMEKAAEGLGADSNAIARVVSIIDELLGLTLSKRIDITTDQKNMLDQRKQARASKDWAKSDELRDTLKEQSIAVRDASYGQVWSRF